MKQASLKLKSYASNVHSNMHIVDNSNLERRILHLMLASFGILGICYVVILGNMTFNIVERKALETNARTVSNDVLQLELTYFDKSSKIDLALAQSMGFTEAKANFATRQSLGSIKLAKNDL